MPLNYETIRNLAFEPELKQYRASDVVRVAKGFGAGLPGPLQQSNLKFLRDDCPEVFPMFAVALGDGKFWQQDPATGLDWRQIVHASEAITVHKPLKCEDEVNVIREVVGVYDRGQSRGALIDEQQKICGSDGAVFVTVDVQTVALANGGFGGVEVPKKVPIDIPDREPDYEIDLLTPAGKDSIFSLSVDLDVASRRPGEGRQPEMLRGVCGFGLAGRAALNQFCDNEPSRLRKLFVKYAGPLFADETLSIRFWRVDNGYAVFNAYSKDRSDLVLGSSFLEYYE